MKRNTSDRSEERCLPKANSLIIVMAVTSFINKYITTTLLVICSFVTLVPSAYAQLENTYLPPLANSGGSSQLPNQACPPAPEPSTVYSTISVIRTRVVQVSEPLTFRTSTSTLLITTTLTSNIQNEVRSTVRVPLERIETVYRQRQVTSTRVVPGRDRVISSTVFSLVVSTVLQQEVKTVESTVVLPAIFYRTSVVNRQQVFTETVQNEQVVTSQQRVPGRQVISTVFQQIVTTRYSTRSPPPVYRTSVFNSVLRQTSVVQVPGRTISVTSTVPVERNVVSTSSIISDQIITRRTTFDRQFERTLFLYRTVITTVTRTSVYTRSINSDVARTRYFTRTSIQTAFRDVQVTQSAPGRQVYSTVLQTDYQYVDVPGRIVNNVRTQFLYRTSTNVVYTTRVVPRVESQRVVVTNTCSGGGYHYTKPSYGLQYGSGGSRGGRQYGGGSYGGGGSSNNEWKPIVG